MSNIVKAKYTPVGKFRFKNVSTDELEFTEDSEGSELTELFEKTTRKVQPKQSQQPKAQEGNEADNEPWPEKVNGHKLLWEIVGEIKRHVYLPCEEDYVAIGLWAFHANALMVNNEIFDVSPFLGVTSRTKRCGKTSLLKVLVRLCSYSKLLGRTTPPAIYHEIEKTKGKLVLLLDEADRYMPGNEIFIGDLNNSCYRETAKIMKIDNNPKKKMESQELSTWCPKVIASIKQIADTVTDRSIVIELERKPQNIKVDNLKAKQREPFITMRRKMLRWIQDNIAAVDGYEPKVPEEINDRAQQCWEPLLAIADSLGGKWSELARNAAVVVGKRNDDEDEDNMDDSTRLLRDCCVAFAQDKQKRKAMSADELINIICWFDENPWDTYRNGRDKITTRKFAILLGEFKVNAKEKFRAHIDEEGKRKWHKADFEKVAMKVFGYIPGQSSGNSESSKSAPGKKAYEQVIPFEERKVHCDDGMVRPLSEAIKLMESGLKIEIVREV